MNENNKLIFKKIFGNLVIAVAIVAYFMLFDFSYFKIESQYLIIAQKVASLIILLLSISIFEFAYNKDSGKLAINGIEILVLALHTLTIWHITNKMNIFLENYILFSVCTFVTYYFLKSILMFTIEKRKYLNSLSDIHEIVIKEPIKKEAKKRTK